MRWRNLLQRQLKGHFLGLRGHVGSRLRRVSFFCARNPRLFLSNDLLLIRGRMHWSSYRFRCSSPGIVIRGIDFLLGECGQDEAG